MLFSSHSHMHTHTHTRMYTEWKQLSLHSAYQQTLTSSILAFFLILIKTYQIDFFTHNFKYTAFDFPNFILQVHCLEYIMVEPQKIANIQDENRYRILYDST